MPTIGLSGTVYTPTISMDRPLTDTFACPPSGSMAPALFVAVVLVSLTNLSLSLPIYAFYLDLQFRLILQALVLYYYASGYMFYHGDFENRLCLVRGKLLSILDMIYLLGLFVVGCWLWVSFLSIAWATPLLLTLSLIPKEANPSTKRKVLTS